MVHDQSQPYSDVPSALETANDLVIREGFLKDASKDSASIL
jgi:hypothetical protein